ncbi:hypothetical protein LBMAG53_27280 [Planctomycetota bacterium]|nr:hypothetical protein LBMAG53_27280 [Planctomycetota bacterium]
MVLVPAGSFTFGAGPKERQLLNRVRKELLEGARAILRSADGTTDFAQAEDLTTVLATAIKQVADARSRESKPHPIPPAVSETAEETANRKQRLAQLVATSEVLSQAQAKVVLAEKMVSWLRAEEPGVVQQVEAFYMDKFAVTIGQYLEFCKATQHEMPFPYKSAVAGAASNKRFPEVADPSFMDPKCPITAVTQLEAKAYAAWVGKRLPTEIEWQYAARGGRDTVFPWGDEPWDGTQANLGGASLVKLNPKYSPSLSHLPKDDRFACLSPVGRFPPNGFGIYDMAGNASNWCDGNPWFMSYLLVKLAGELPKDFVEPRAKDPYFGGHTIEECQPLCGSGYLNTEFDARVTHRYGTLLMHGEPERGFRCVRNPTDGSTGTR